MVWTWTNQATSIATTGPSFPNHSHRPTIISSYAFLRKSGSLVAVWIKSLATAARCSFCSGSRSWGMNFCHDKFMPRSCVKISDTVFWIPRSASSFCIVSHRSLLIASRTCSTFSGVLLVAGPLECGSVSTDSQPSLKHLWHTVICTALIASSPKAFWITQIVFVEECSSSMLNLMQIHCSTRSVILSVTATQCTCSLNGIYHPHWLVHWSHCSCMCIPVHSPWLPGHINVV